MALSSITRVADGIQSQFSFTFGYLSRSHVFLFVNNTLASYKWIGEFLLEPLVVPLPGDVVTIRRLTDRANRVTTYTDGQTLLAESLNAGDLQVFYIAQEMIDQIEEGIVAGDVSVINPGTGYITAAWIQSQLSANLAAAPQFAAIDAALVAEAAARAAAITAETTARGAAITAEAAARTASVASLTAADAAAVGRLNIVESDLNTPTTGVKAKLVTVENAVATETSARASADTAILAEINTPVTGLKARATSLESRTTAVEANKAEASALSALTARVTTAENDINLAEASVVTETNARVSADNALSSAATALTARVGTAEGNITTINSTIATETAARVSADNALSAEINTPTTGLKARATSLETRVTTVETNKAETTALNSLSATLTTADENINRRLAILNQNPYFDEGPTATGIIPYRWAAWSEGRTGDIITRPGGLGSGLCLRSNAISGTPAVGWQQDGLPNLLRTGEQLTIRASIKQDNGSIAASAALLIFLDASGNSLAFTAANYIRLGAEADMAGLTSASSTTGIRTWEKTVTVPAGAIRYRLFALTTWATAGTMPATSPLIYWLECSVRPANGAATSLSVANAAIVNEIAARATGDAANATSITSLETTFFGGQEMILNPQFKTFTSASGVPNSWEEWINGAANTTRVVNDTEPGSTWCARVNVPDAAQNYGWNQYMTLSADGGGRVLKLKVSARINSGTWPGAAVDVMCYSNGYGAVLGTFRIRFSTDADVSGVTSGTATGRRTWERTFTVPAGTRHIRVLGFANYPSVFSPSVVKNMDWFEISLRDAAGYGAGVAELREALSTGNSSQARLLFNVNTTNNEATIEAAAFTGDGVWNGSAISLNADLIRLMARSINFGTNTVFEDTRGSIHTTNSGRRLRILGPFGTSLDLVMWYGPTSVALNSETKTNGYFAFATDGKVYYGTTELPGGGSAGRSKTATGANSFSANSAWQTLAIVGYGDIPNPSTFSVTGINLVGQSQSGIAVGSGYEWRVVHAPAANFSDVVVLRSGTFTLTAGGVGEPPVVSAISTVNTDPVAAARYGAVNCFLQIQRTSGTATVGIQGTLNITSILP